MAFSLWMGKYVFSVKNMNGHITRTSVVVQWHLLRKCLSQTSQATPKDGTHPSVDLVPFVTRIAHTPVDKLESKFVALKSKKVKSSADKVKHFVDYRKILVQGGNGGDGCISFLRSFCNPKAGPDGGDGGHGGHVIFKATSDLKSLEHLDSYIGGKPGNNGGNKNCTGGNASDTIVEVPIGTTFRLEGEVVASLEEEGAMFVAARGGAGGKGNVFFTTNIDQAPRIAEYGGRGEQVSYGVELRTMADVGLIGFPNAGKSTLLRAISRARPKVAAYPFTTQNPHVGMVQYADFQQLAVADIPGLIEGAHKNHGLGIAFLRHIERCSCLLYVIDIAQPRPLDQLETLRYELEQYEEGLSTRPSIIVANKMDLPEAQANFESFKSGVNLPTLGVSAKLGLSLTPLLASIRLLVDYNHEQKSALL